MLDQYVNGEALLEQVCSNMYERSDLPVFATRDGLLRQLAQSPTMQKNGRMGMTVFYLGIQQERAPDGYIWKNICIHKQMFEIVEHHA